MSHLRGYETMGRLNNRFWKPLHFFLLVNTIVSVIIFFLFVCVPFLHCQPPDDKGRWTPIVRCDSACLESSPLYCCFVQPLDKDEMQANVCGVSSLSSTLIHLFNLIPEKYYPKCISMLQIATYSIENVQSNTAYLTHQSFCNAVNKTV